MKECFLCHRMAFTERHHIFGAACRSKSERYGLVVNLCHWCHNEPPKGVHHNKESALYVKQYGQRKAMQENGWSTEDFIREFGKNYL